MYVSGAPAWVEYGPQSRRRSCGGLGDVVTLSLPQLDQTANSPSWTGSVTNTIGTSTLNDGGAFSFLTDPTASTLCVMGADPANPNCLSAAGLALQAAAGTASKSAAAAAPSLLSSPIAIGVGLLFAVLLIGGKR